MRKLIVSNFLTLDGLYEGKDKSINSLYDYYYEDYSGDHSFDFYNAELLRAADFHPAKPQRVFRQQRVLDGCTE